jgi:peptidoglycan-associated lipoprotein
LPKVEPPLPPPVQNGPAGVSKIVYFDFDKYNIRPQDREIVEAHASYMRNRTSSRVVIEGNTDQRGGREYNLALGQRRADSVQRALTQLGVPAERIEAISWGTEKPASTANHRGGLSAQSPGRIQLPLNRTTAMTSTAVSGSRPPHRSESR